MSPERVDVHECCRRRRVQQCPEDESEHSAGVSMPSPDMAIHARKRSHTPNPAGASGQLRRITNWCTIAAAANHSAMSPNPLIHQIGNPTKTTPGQSGAVGVLSSWTSALYQSIWRRGRKGSGIDCHEDGPRLAWQALRGPLRITKLTEAVP